MSTYWSILEKMPGSKLRLTKMDDDIHEHLQKDFPELDVSQTINEDDMKSKGGKERWRNFMMAYEKKVRSLNIAYSSRSDTSSGIGGGLQLWHSASLESDF